MFRSLGAAGFILGIATDAQATDEIVCKSVGFSVGLAVGYEGHVPSMVITNTSRAYFSDDIAITNLKRGRVSVQSKSVDVEAFLGMKNAGTVVIQIRRGGGFIRFGSHKESMTCDWDV